MVGFHRPGIRIADRAGHFQGDELVVEIILVKLVGDEQLAQVAHAVGAFGLLFGGAQRREQHRGQNGDDRDHHQQLDQGEPHAWPPQTQDGKDAVCASQAAHLDHTRIVTETGPLLQAFRHCFRIFGGSVGRQPIRQRRVKTAGRKAREATTHVPVPMAMTPPKLAMP